MMSVKSRTDNHTVSVYPSPGRQDFTFNGPATPRVVETAPGEHKLEAVEFRSSGAFTGPTLVVWSDGSFRHIVQRRGQAVSGRQRRLKRKQSRRAAKAIGTNDANTTVGSNDNDNVNAVNGE